MPDFAHWLKSLVHRAAQLLPGNDDDASTAAMLDLRCLRELLLAPGEHPRDIGHLSAASGLVRVGTRHYVVADDEHHLGVFGADADEPVRLIRVVDGDLPAGKKPRKAVKPDLEALIVLPPLAPGMAGALVALGSGSRPTRHRGVVLDLDDAGLTVGTPRLLDLSPLHAPLIERFGALNLEGGFVVRDSLCLLQRGNGVDGVNAAIAYDLAAVMAWMAQPDGAVPEPRSVTPFALGAIDGTALGFTDGAALPGGAWMFSAVAEASDDSYSDGGCKGSVIGFVGADGTLGRLHRLAGDPKVEGICALVAEHRLALLVVTDADDPKVPARLLGADVAFTAELVGAAPS